MKDPANVHKQVQEMCDCYATNDPLKEMSTLGSEADAAVGAVKWWALTALHGVNANAEKISIRRDAAGAVTVQAKYRPADLPAPGEAVGSQVFEAFRQITHIEGDKGKTAMALGIRESSLELGVKFKKKKDYEQITIKFPA
ncbi:MAG: hypothetical protein QNJ22_16500 [Desulfosarcinaceae bacterium]|nr:hypothetical protein [Desulfosarcinaceae bacterium]